jgi:glycosyltransferase involved in cell wall biosynthesis
MILQLPANISVLYHGELPPPELLKAMNEFQLFIMPSKSENFGHALLEALSAGKPVITTNTTPFKDLQAVKAGYTIITDQADKELPEAIRFFAGMQQGEFSVYAANAAEYAGNFYAKERLQQQYQHLFTTA